MPVRNKVKQFVDAQGIKPYGLSKQSGVSLPTVYRLYNDKDNVPTLETVEQFCDAFPGSRIEDWIEYVPKED